MHDLSPTGTNPRRVSLRWLIPAASAVILTGVIVAFGSLAYGFARTAALETATKRLATVAEAFAQPVQPEPAWARLARGVAASQGVLEVLRTGGQQVPSGAVEQLSEFLADTAQSLAVDIRRPDGSVVFSLASPRADALSTLGEPTAPSDGPSPAIVTSNVTMAPVLH